MDGQGDGGKEGWTDRQSGVHKTSTPSTPVGYQAGYKVGYIRDLTILEGSRIKRKFYNSLVEGR